ncbi:TnsA-like heteromeric transposase endonuclease subunit [Embleya sp. NBC_00896]|uniref:TnsA-like heteromeric transposase endonuclease subunit n=1 Tax=Embleya sp. NBC_00896 TaxID=2975961 RepID=UPI002F906C00
MFARYADGTALLADCPGSPGAGGVRALRAGGVVAAACEAVGWSYRRLEPPDPVLVANVRWLAGYRHPRHRGSPAVEAAVMDAFARARPLIEGVRAVGDPIVVWPVVFHALWSGRLSVVLSRPLHERVPAWAGPGSRRWSARRPRVGCRGERRGSAAGGRGGRACGVRGAFVAGGRSGGSGGAAGGRAGCGRVDAGRVPVRGPGLRAGGCGRLWRGCCRGAGSRRCRCESASGRSRGSGTSTRSSAGCRTARAVWGCARAQYGPGRSMAERERAKVEEMRASGWAVSVATVQRMRGRYRRQGLWGLVDKRATRGASATGRSDERVVVAVLEGVAAAAGAVEGDGGGVAAVGRGDPGPGAWAGCGGLAVAGDVLSAGERFADSAERAGRPARTASATTPPFAPVGVAAASRSRSTAPAWT